MDYRTTDIRTGLFIAFSIAAATVLIFLMGGVRGAFRDARALRVLFDDVRLLEPEAPVTLGGFRVGEVARITRHEDAGAAAGKEYKVEVLLAVDRNLDLRTDAMAMVRTDGFLGKKFVALSPGMSPEKLRPDAPIVGHAETDLTTIMGQLEEPIARLNRILIVVEKVAGNEANIENAEGVVAETNALLKRIRATSLPEAEALVAALRGTTRRVDEKAEELGTKVSATLDRAVRTLETLAEKVGAGVDSFDAVVKESRALVGESRAAVKDIRGDVGRLLVNADRLVADNNRNIYLAIRNVRDATAELDRLLRKLRADPSVVVWGDQEKVGPPPEPPDFDAVRRAGRARRYGKEPGK